MANTSGEKELKTDWDEFGNIGSQMNLVYERATFVSPKDTVGL